MHANATARTEVREQQIEKTSGLLFGFCPLMPRESSSRAAIMCKLSLLMLIHEGTKNQREEKDTPSGRQRLEHFAPRVLRH
jgi:hypothetical protein